MSETEKGAIFSLTAPWVDPALWVLAFACAGLTFYFSVAHPPAPLRAINMSDKVWHFLAYFSTVGAFLVAAVWRLGRGKGLFPWAAPFLVIGAIVAGSIIEVLQGRYFHRDMDPKDALADTVGALLAYGIWRLFRVVIEKRNA